MLTQGKFVRAEDGEEVAYFTTTNSYKIIFGAIAEKTILMLKSRNMSKEKVVLNLEV